ncbi:MAG: hypothetical protein FWC50_03090 [Planctomycetaceae bacterium]|nr:hypothetical protein [Planctomycetaceae bacterium]
MIVILHINPVSGKSLKVFGKRLKFHIGQSQILLAAQLPEFIPQPVWAAAFGLDETSCVAGLAVSSFGNFKVGFSISGERNEKRS